MTEQPERLPRRDFLSRTGTAALGVGVGGLLAESATVAAPAANASTFGYTSGDGYYTVDTGAGLVFKVSQSNGDLTSMKYNGTECNSQTTGSHVESGLGSTAVVSAYQTGNYIVVTESVTNWYGSGTLYHYFVAVSGQNNIYMATYVDANGGGELRWISELDRSVIGNVLTQADQKGGTAIEATDIFLVNGRTHSKYYSNRQAQNLTVRGVTGSGIGVYMAFGSRESSAGGPFFRDIEQQGTDSTNNFYNYLYSAHNQTENQRLGVLYGPYCLMVTGGSTPSAPDMSFLYDFGFHGSVGSSGRGYLEGKAVGVDSGVTATVGFANSAAQYWATCSANGDYASPAMKAGTYTMTLYQGELNVASKSVTVTAGTTTTGINIDSAWTTPAAIWRIGTWDGTPSNFLNWSNLTWMHPSDTRMSGWGPVTYTVGSSSAGQFPAYQWKDVNDPTTIRFTLTSAQVAAHTVRIGISAAYANGRPRITVNGWTSGQPGPSTQPSSRSLTIGTYRGNNAQFTFSVPASAFVAGTNTMTISVISGSGSSAYLSAGISYDCVELY